jgi:hypothetical protein
MQQQNFTPRQLEALDFLKRIYPSGAGIAVGDHRAVFDAIIERGSGLVELIDSDETPTGDAYRLTDEAAEAFREDAGDRAGEAGLN